MKLTVKLLHCWHAACLAAGRVDYKVCAVDAAWSGLLFTRRGRTSGNNT
jgi:hypothetical protein